MIIPKGVNHHEFLKIAMAKGIKIQSRFVGVYLSFNTNGSPSWMARYQEKGKNLFFRRHPFTEQGEKEASRQYEMFIISRNLHKRRSAKSVGI